MKEKAQLISEKRKNYAFISKKKTVQIFALAQKNNIFIGCCRQMKNRKRNENSLQFFSITIIHSTDNYLRLNR